MSKNHPTLDKEPGDTPRPAGELAAEGSAARLGLVSGLPREDRGPILSCIHPDRA